MKKEYFYFILLFSLFVLCFCVSCSKNKNENEKIADKHKHRAIPITTNKDSNSGVGDGYYMETQFGHKAEGCSGCYRVGDYFIHINCAGPGTFCEAAVGIVVYNTHGVFFNAVTLEENELTDSDVFYMPERSLFIEGDGNSETWLNIPEQPSFKDAATGQFTFTDLFYSNYQVFENK